MCKYRIIFSTHRIIIEQIPDLDRNTITKQFGANLCYSSDIGKCIYSYKSRFRLLSKSLSNEVSSSGSCVQNPHARFYVHDFCCKFIIQTWQFIIDIKAIILPYVFPDGAPRFWHHDGSRALGIRHEGRIMVYYHPGDVNDAWKDGHSGASAEVADQAYKLGVNVMFYAFNQYYRRHYGDDE